MPDRAAARSATPRSQPRFGLGELVMVRSTIDPSRNVDCTRVIDRQWYEGWAEWGWYTGWQYIVARHVDAWAVESSLRPRPEAGSLDWKALKRDLGSASGPAPASPVGPAATPGTRPRRRLPVRRMPTVPTDAVPADPAPAHIRTGELRTGELRTGELRGRMTRRDDPSSPR